MLPLYIFGHQSGVGKVDTIVPPGLTVHLYAEADKELRSVNGMAIVMKGPTIGDIESFQPGSIMPNYGIAPFTDSEDAGGELTAVLNSNADGKFNYHFTASKDWLCRSDRAEDYCVREAKRLKRKGKFHLFSHTCNGILGRLGRGAIDGLPRTGDLHLLICRTRSGRTPAVTDRLPGETSPEFLRTMHAGVQRLMHLVATDAQKAEKFFDGLNHVTQAMFLQRSEVRDWSHTRYACEFLLEHGAFAYLRLWRAQSDADKAMYDRHPALLKARQEAEGYANWFATLDDDARRATWHALPADEDRTSLASLLSLESWAATIHLRDLADARNAEVLTSLANGDHLLFAQAGGTVAIGDGHDWAVAKYVWGSNADHLQANGKILKHKRAVYAWFEQNDSPEERKKFTEALHRAGIPGEIHWGRP